MGFYQELDYRAALRLVFDEKKTHIHSLTFQKMAIACRVQSPYLSKILSKHAHMNADQLFLACQYLKLREEEREYLALLLEHSRSIVPERKEKLLKRIREIQDEKNQVKERLPARLGKGDSAGDAEFWLDPYAMVVLAGLLIDSVSKDPFSLAPALRLSKERISSILEKLVRSGFAELKQGRWIPTQANLHLPKDSPVEPAYQQITRMSALEHLVRTERRSGQHTAITFCADERAFSKIQGLFLDWLKEFDACIQPAPNEGIYQMNFDLFSWMGGRKK